MSGELDRTRRQDLLAPQDSALERLPQQQPDFFMFRYSSTEIFSQDGNLHMKRRETRYQDGRLMSEECEGMLERQAYEQMVRQAQGLFLQQLGGWLRLFYAPFFGRGRE